MNLNEAITLFLDQYKKTTRKAYAVCLHPFAQWVGPARTVGEVTEIDALRYTNKIRQSHYAPATMRKHIKSLKTFFNWAIDLGIMPPPSPMQKIKNVIVDMYIGRGKALPDSDLDKIIAFMDRNERAYVRHRALILFLADTGCRAGGAANLTWADVDLKTGTAIITEKGDRTRPSFFFESTTFALLDWQKEQERTQGDYVFGYRGNKITSASLQQMFRRLCIDSGIGSHGPHKLRHRKAHQLVDAGIAPSTAATVIGDTPEVFISHYAPRDFDSAREAARQVSTRPKKDDKIIKTSRVKSGS